MADQVVVAESSSELWHSFLTRFPEGNLEQTFEYGEASRIAFPNTRVARLMAINRDKLVGVVQGIHSRRFGLGTCLKVSNAPLTDVGRGNNLRVVKNLLRALEAYGIRNRIVSVQIWWPESWGMQAAFHDLKYGVAKKINRYHVNLNTAEGLWKSIAHNKRRNIKKAIKMGVRVLQSRDKDDILTFFRLLEESGRRHGFSVDPLAWFEAVCRVYKQQRNFPRVFLARWNGKDVAGVFITIHGKSVYALAAGSSSRAWKPRPNDLLHWKVMEWACQQDFSKYSMGFVSEPTPMEKSGSWGIWRWKREWKGSLAVTRVYQKLLIPRIFHRVFLPAYKCMSRARSIFGRIV